MINKIKNIQKYLLGGKEGFTLVETLIAVLLLATAIAGPLTIASRGLTASLVAKDQVTAYYLAQDAIEYARWIRDTNKLCGHSWLAGLNGISGNGHTNTSGGGGAIPPACNTNGSPLVDCTTHTCAINSLADTVSQCDSMEGSACAVLYYDATNKYFTHTTGIMGRTIFRRVIGLTASAGNSNEYILTATVKWIDTGGNFRSVVIQEYIYNWQ
ncbi:hypothetical protein H7X87_03590 [Acetobacteraceae bacterium]|nr:hypothetical protein [Candidatus Parcubacteria bacterium]